MGYSTDLRACQQMRCALTGVGITPITKADVLRVTKDLQLSGERSLIVGHNLHSAYLFHTDARLRSVYGRADIILADGKPIELDAKVSSIFRRERMQCERMGSTDWLPDLLPRLAGMNVAVVGAMPDANASFVEFIQSAAEGATVKGIPGDSWDKKASSVPKQLMAFQPNVVLVGLGMPLQEHFMYAHWAQLPPAQYVLVGGAIDQLTGEQVLAPRWLGNLGLEWLWRLLSQPRRLAGRYLVEPWKLIVVRVKQCLT